MTGVYKCYDSIPKRYNLYLTEKLEVLDDQNKILLNENSEIIFQYYQQNACKLKNNSIKRKDIVKDNSTL